jgi:hypothetical protein
MAAHLDVPPGMKYTTFRMPEPVIDISRDKAVQLAIQNGAKWLFFWDTDLILPKDALTKLLAADKPIIGGLYVRRHNPPFNEMLRYRTDGLPGMMPVRDGEYQMGEVLPVDAIATGCMLVKTEIFEKIKPFQITIDGQPARPAWFLWTEWRLPNGQSEDFSFCSRARQSGIPIFCDTSIHCQHIGPMKFKPSGTNTLNLAFPGEN